MKFLIFTLLWVGILFEITNADSNIRSKYCISLRPKRIFVDKEPAKNNSPKLHPQRKSPHKDSPNDVTWVVIDSMQNTYGTSNTNINPLVYDVASNTLAFIHRGALSYSSSSGSMWYNYSFDNSQTWSRVPVALNFNTSQLGRYPSSTIVNPQKTSNPYSTTFLYSYPELDPVNFGYLGFGSDSLAAGNPFTTIWMDHNFGSETFMWASDNEEQSAYFLVRHPGFDSTWLTFWRTTDRGDSWVEKNNWYNWAELFSWRGQCVQDTLYVESVVIDSVIADHITFRINKSFNNGENWLGWETIDWKTIPLLSHYDNFGTLDGTIAHDFIVDGNGMEHFFFSLIDTNATSGGFDIVEMYRTSDGWNARVIAPRTFSFHPGIGSLSQMDNELHATISEDKTTIALTWIDAPTEGETQGDIFVCGKNINSNWGTIRNITQTSGWFGREMSTHLAPRMKNAMNDSVTIFLTKTESLDSTIVDDSLNETQPCAIWCAKATFSISPRVGIEENGKHFAKSFSLFQNYPNPFNPKTSILFSLLTANNVSLIVYDIYGREIAVLMKEKKDADEYSIEWNAENFPSGLYFYRLTILNQSVTKKMVLIK